MKSFLTIFLFASFIAGLRADDLDGFLLDDGADGVDPTKHPYFQCKMDMYGCITTGVKGKLGCLMDYKSCMAVLIPTIPPHVKQCQAKAKECFANASDWKGRFQCTKELAICLKNGAPTQAPSVASAV
ncbi:hypothetical protein OS493_013872 [Desmophyllum pertusum]|uniref:Uncharacterized protein n=1 Tax=Desmophyllum pertusum TaxID=174260 RepID=A0A9W9ZQ08_9CNID|nr:hypothetical protein OS493_013872 [Desmophyllum pertusum]